MTVPQTLFEKVWNNHVVVQNRDQPAIFYIDLHLLHEVTSPQAFEGLRQRGRKVRRPERTLATMDHSISTLPRLLRVVDAQAETQLRRLEENCLEFGVTLYAMDSEHQGIVHVIGPELGRTQPGMTIVCGDSHTSTHGAFGALAFGIGTSEVEYVLASQCLLQTKPKTCEVRLEGVVPKGVTAKDIILALIATIGVGGGTGYVLEYTGAAVQALDMEGRMTLCNMSIEAGARAGMIAPDETTFAYLCGRPFAPKGAAWEAAVDRWKKLPTDPGSTYDRTVTLDVSQLEPMITYGTNPAMGIAIGAPVPAPEHFEDPLQRAAFEKALRYMDLPPARPLLGHKIDVVFLGSCTNSRLSDLRQAARLLRGKHIAPGLRMLVVPGSQAVKKQAELEGLHDVFVAAGAEWREPGCSMCIAMNGDELKSGEYAVSTSNRNFEGRQGAGGRTFLASPLTAAASALQGCVADPRSLLEGWT